MTSLQNVVESNDSKSQILALTNLKSCVQSSATVVSSATTVLGVEDPDRISVTYGSDFGDVFPSQPGEAMLRWMSSNTVYEFEEDDLDTRPARRKSPTGAKLGEKLQVVDESSLSEQSDSDADLEMEMLQALLKRGKEKMAGKDLEGAEKFFKNCLARATALPMATKSRAEAMKLLIDIYLENAKWDEAQSLLLEKIALGSRDKAVGKERVLAETLTLVNVLLQKNAYAEALLYGRRAFKGYRKLGAKGRDGIETSLNLIVKTCHLEGSFDEEDAYAAILSEFLEQTPLMTSTTDAAEISTSSLLPSSISPVATASATEHHATLSVPSLETVTSSSDTTFKPNESHTPVLEALEKKDEESLNGSEQPFGPAPKELGSVSKPSDNLTQIKSGKDYQQPEPESPFQVEFPGLSHSISPADKRPIDDQLQVEAAQLQMNEEEGDPSKDPTSPTFSTGSANAGIFNFILPFPVSILDSFTDTQGT
jgi:hypothetical protein